MLPSFGLVYITLIQPTGAPTVVAALTRCNGGEVIADVPRKGIRYLEHLQRLTGG